MLPLNNEIVRLYFRAMDFCVHTITQNLNRIYLDIDSIKRSIKVVFYYKQKPVWHEIILMDDFQTDLEVHHVTCINSFDNPYIVETVYYVLDDDKAYNNHEYLLFAFYHPSVKPGFHPKKELQLAFSILEGASLTKLSIYHYSSILTLFHITERMEEMWLKVSIETKEVEIGIYFNQKVLETDLNLLEYMTKSLAEYLKIFDCSYQIYNDFIDSGKFDYKLFALYDWHKEIDDYSEWGFIS